MTKYDCDHPYDSNAHKGRGCCDHPLRCHPPVKRFAVTELISYYVEEVSEERVRALITKAEHSHVYQVDWEVVGRKIEEL